MKTKGHCKWHEHIQSKLTEVKKLVTNHQQKKLNKEQSKRNEELVKKFVWFKKERKGKYGNK